ncbi:MAG: rfaE bifunctional protein nucleotidyltransferase chain/domain [Flavobacteriales bacterium]|jgi:rfaE bifunctional protein nucleotidyltransferase chain/domain
MKSYSLNDIKTELEKWKSNGEKVVFTNGVFDILHVGHVDYLSRAKALGDRLIVGVNDDASVRRLNKAPERPINPERARCQIIDTLKPVDAVVMFGEDTPLHIIKDLLPGILVKGGDYDASVTDANDPRYIVGSVEVIEAGGRVEALALVEGFSTTNILSKLNSGKS